MAFDVAALIAEGDVRVQNADRVGDSFPGFATSMGAIG
jgi:5-enolpyruvylshikimate-3-phosphate synthase